MPRPILNMFLFASASALALAACTNASQNATSPAPISAKIIPDADAYARAEAALPQNIDDLVHNARITVTWIGETGQHFWYRRDTASGQEWVLINTSDRSRNALFDHAELAEKLNAALKVDFAATDLPLTAISVEDDLSAITFNAEDESWHYDLGTGTLNREEQHEDSEGTASPDGKWQAFFHNNNIYLRNRDGSITRQLTTEGSDTKRCGARLPNPRNLLRTPYDPAEWYSADVEWASDSNRLTAYCIDIVGSGSLTLTRAVPPDGGLRADTVTYTYALTNDETVPTATGMLFNLEAGTRIDFDLPPQPILYYYGPNYNWSKDDQRLFTVIPARDYRSLDLIEIDPATGQSKTVFSETNPDIIDYYGHWWNYNEKSDQYFWMSDRTGWSHLYAIDGTTHALNQITVGDWRFRYVVRTVGEINPTLFIVGSGREGDRDPYLRTLYRTPSSGGGLTLLTPEPLDHDISVAPDGSVFVDNMSAMDTPTRTVLRDGSTGDILMDLESADISGFTQAGYSLPTPFQAVAADGETELFGAWYRPADFDPNKSYPLIDNIYTGPHYVMTPKSFSDAVFGRTALSVAQAGFIVATVDGRGTNRRSRAFLQPSFENLNLVGLDDHETALRQLAAQYDWIDIDRVGIYGFSAGGYDTARALFRKPDFYKAGVSASGNHDHRSDKAIWNENWFGFPIDHDKLEDNSNLNWVDNLKGDLFLAHGELDENVHPMATLQLVDRLIAAGKDFEMLIVPGEDHFLDDNNYFNRRRLDFFVESLHGTLPPDYLFGKSEENENAD